MTRLWAVPHFPSVIVERTKRDGAWKSPHARKARRSGESPRLAFLAWGDFHPRSRLGRSISLRENEALPVVYSMMSIIEHFTDFLGGYRAFQRGKWSILVGKQKYNVQHRLQMHFATQNVWKLHPEAPLMCKDGGIFFEVFFWRGVVGELTNDSVVGEAELTLSLSLFIVVFCFGKIGVTQERMICQPRGTWVLSKLQGLQYYFPKHFRSNLTHRRREFLRLPSPPHFWVRKF